MKTLTYIKKKTYDNAPLQIDFNELGAGYAELYGHGRTI